MMHALSLRRFRDVLSHWLHSLFHHPHHDADASHEFEQFFNK